MRILWIPHTGWHIPQRAHLFCRSLAERHEVHVTDWIADFTTLRDYMSMRYLRNFTYRQRRDGNIVVHGIPRISPALFVPALRQINRAIFSKIVQHVIKRHKLDVVVGTFVVPPPQAPRVVFDLFDDNGAYWRSYGRTPAYADEIEQTEQRYLESADAVVAASLVLVDKAQALRATDVHYIPNGVELQQFKQVQGRPRVRTSGMLQYVAGSIGSHDKSAELDKLLDAAKLLSNDNVTVLIAGRGSAMPAAQERAQRENLSNVVFRGYVAPDTLPTLLETLDVGLCPYLKTPGADASNPMRLLTYAAAGRPAVCTDLESVRRMKLPNVVLVDDNAHALAAGIRTALRLPRQQPPQIEQYNLPALVAQYEAVLIGNR